MKKVLYSLLFVGASFAANAQIEVTFRVDMTGVNRTIPADAKNGDGVAVTDTINVTGSFGAKAGFVDWTPNTIHLQRVGTSNIYQRIVTVSDPGKYEFKFLRGTFWNYKGPDGDVQLSEQKGGFPADNQTCLSGDNRSLDLSSATAGSKVKMEFSWEKCSLVSGTQGIPAITRYAISPNPFNANARISFNNEGNATYSLQITNVAGQVVRNYNGIKTDFVDIDRANLAAGLYIATLRSQEGGVLPIKLVIE